MRMSILGFIAALSFSAIVAPAHAVSVNTTVDPAGAINVGDIVRITVSVDSGTELFDGFEFDATFDPAVLAYRADLADFSVFTPVFTLTSPGIPTAPGTITAVTAGGFLADYAGSFDLVTIAFEAIAAGTSTVTVSDFLGSTFIVYRGQNVFSGVSLSNDITVLDGPAVIPLPATALLLPTALAGLALVRRRRSMV